MKHLKLINYYFTPKLDSKFLWYFSHLRYANRKRHKLKHKANSKKNKTQQTATENTE